MKELEKKSSEEEASEDEEMETDQENEEDEEMQIYEDEEDGLDKCVLLRFFSMNLKALY